MCGGGGWNDVRGWVFNIVFLAAQDEWDVKTVHCVCGSVCSLIYSVQLSPRTSYE